MYTELIFVKLNKKGLSIADIMAGTKCDNSTNICMVFYTGLKLLIPILHDGTDRSGRFISVIKQTVGYYKGKRMFQSTTTI